MSQSIFIANPFIDGDQVIYVYPSVGGSMNLNSLTAGSSNKDSNMSMTFHSDYCTEPRNFKIKIADVYEDYGLFGYLWSVDAGTSYMGATQLETATPVNAPFIGTFGVTTYDQPNLIVTDQGDCLALAQKWDSTGKQVVCRKFDYSDYVWGDEVVIDSTTTAQSYPAGYLIDGKHIAVGFIDDTDTGNRKVKFSVSQDLLGLTWDSMNEFATSKQIYNLSLCKIGDNIIAAYDDGTDSLNRVSYNNGLYFSAEAYEVTIESAMTNPHVTNNGNGIFLCLGIMGSTPSVYGKISQYGQSWIDIDSPNPLIAGDGVTDTMSLPYAFLDDNGNIIALARSDQGATYMRYSYDYGRNWYDISSITEDILPDCAGLAGCITGGLTMFLQKGLGTAGTIGALISRTWINDTYPLFLNTPLSEDYYAINGKPDDLGYTLDGTDESSISSDARKIDTVSAGGAAQTYYRKAWSPTMTDGFLDIFRMKITSGGGNNESCERRYDVDASISFALCFSTIGCVMKDLQGASDLKTDTHDYTHYHDFAFACKKISGNVHWKLYRKETSVAWNGTWTLMGSGVDDGYLAEGGSRTSQEGFGDNDTAVGENSTSYWESIFYQDLTDDSIAEVTPTTRSRKMSAKSPAIHMFSHEVGFSASGKGAKNDIYDALIDTNISYSNLFSTYLDAPLYSQEDNITWSIYLNMGQMADNALYHFDILAFFAANVRKINVYGTNTDAGATVVSGKSFDSFPDDGTWVLLGTPDSFTGDTGSITAIGEGWLTVSGKTWQKHELKGKLAEVVHGAESKIYNITQNTGDTIIFDNGIALISDGFTVGDTLNICSGGAAQIVSAMSYRWLCIEIEPVYTEDGVYKLPLFIPAFRYAPDILFFNPSIDDNTLREFLPNNDVYVSRSGKRRVHKLGPHRKQRTMFFIESADDDTLREFESWVSFVDFENTAILYIEDTEDVLNGNYYNLRCGRIMGGMKMTHNIEDKFSIDPLLFSEEV